MADGSSGGQERLLQLAGLVLAPAGVVAALLYYFGYVREQAFFAYFGVDLGTVGFSSTDYVVRSAGSVFVLVAVLLLVTLAAVVAHHALTYVLARSAPRTRGLVWVVLGGLSLVLLVLGVVALARRGDPLVHPLLGPVAIGAGAVVLDYVVLRLAVTAPKALVDTVAATRGLRRGLTAGLVLVALFWGMANVAQRRGLDAAEAVEVSLLVRPQAVVYSSEQLVIRGHGVGVQPLAAADSVYRFRYNGLRVLAHTEETWFLVPAGWTHENGDVVVLLSDSQEGVRVDLAPSSTASAPSSTA